MQTRNLLLAAVVLACGAGFVMSKREGALAAPDEVKAIACQPGAKYLVPGAVDVFEIRGVVLALACEPYGNGKLMVKQWEAAEKRNPGKPNPDSYLPYGFSKRADGRIERDADNNRRPLSSQTQYVVQAVMGDNVAGPLEVNRAMDRWSSELLTPTPPAFAETGSQTRWWCTSPGHHDQTRYECSTRVRSGLLPWNIRIIFGFPQQEKFDVKPEVIEAYRLLAAHIIR